MVTGLISAHQLLAAVGTADSLDVADIVALVDIVDYRVGVALLATPVVEASADIRDPVVCRVDRDLVVIRDFQAQAVDQDLVVSQCQAIAAIAGKVSAVYLDIAEKAAADSVA